MFSGFIDTALGLIPLLVLRICCYINLSYIFWIYLAAIVSGTVSLLAFAFLSESYRRPEPFWLKKKVEYYKKINENWKRDPELIKADKKFHPAISLYSLLATFGCLVNIVASALYVLSKYGIEIIGFTFLLWVGIVSIVLSVGGAYFIRQVSDVKNFADSI